MDEQDQARKTGLDNVGPMTMPSCPLCDSPTRPLDTGARWTRCDSCQAMVFPPGQGQQILIAHGSEETSSRLGVSLLEHGFGPLRAQDGSQAVQMLERYQPPAMILDVAIEKILSFQLIDQIRKAPQLATTRIILVASVFNKTAYKCKPTSLYGADDYVEIHHLLDKLPQKLRTLLGAPKQTPAQMEPTPPYPAPFVQDASVTRLARQIVADIALYHQAEIEAIMQQGDIDTMSPALLEGRRLLSEQVPNPYQGDPILEAWLDMIAAMRSQ